MSWANNAAAAATLILISIITFTSSTTTEHVNVTIGSNLNDKYGPGTSINGTRWLEKGHEGGVVNQHLESFGAVGTENTTNADYEDEASGTPSTEEILEYIYPKTWTWALIFFHFVVFVVGLVGNCLVCVAVYRNRTMRTVTNYFIVNLAVADFLVILFCLPPSVVWDVTSTWWFGIAMCKTVLYLQVRSSSSF